MLQKPAVATVCEAERLILILFLHWTMSDPALATGAGVTDTSIESLTGRQLLTALLVKYNLRDWGGLSSSAMEGV